MKWTTLCFHDENIFFPGLGWNHFSHQKHHHGHLHAGSSKSWWHFNESVGMIQFGGLSQGHWTICCSGHAGERFVKAGSADVRKYKWKRLYVCKYKCHAHFVVTATPRLKCFIFVLDVDENLQGNWVILTFPSKWGHRVSLWCSNRANCPIRHITHIIMANCHNLAQDQPERQSQAIQIQTQIHIQIQM